MAQLFFKYGAMFSGKSMDLIKVYTNYEVQGKKAIVLKPKVDTRNDGIETRLGINIPALYVEDELGGRLSWDILSADCILVDEAQFLTREQIVNLRDIATFHDIPVIAYGLKNDFENNLFEGSEALLIYSDKIEEIKTVCQYCNRKATMNARISGSDEQVEVGNNYVPVCHEHWEELND